MIPPKKPNVGPVLTITTPLVLATIVGVAIAAVWGLDWRWIPTALLAGFVILVTGGYIDTVMQRRATERELKRQLEEARQKMKGHPLYPIAEALNRAFDPPTTPTEAVKREQQQ